jgi:hypothetical protein
MPQHRVTVSKVIKAPPQRLYELLADYHHGHPSILPRPEFRSLTVVQGGHGQGTVFDMQMRVLGRTRSLRGVVSEPEPGRRLVESYVGEPIITSFMVEPMFSGEHAQVTITTDTDVHGGLRGALERGLATRRLQQLYRRELEKLAAAATAEL